MKMGRERGIIRWDVHVTLLLDRIARAEEALAALATPSTPREQERAARVLSELNESRARLHALGPSPRAKMG